METAKLRAVVGVMCLIASTAMAVAAETARAPKAPKAAGAQRVPPIEKLSCTTGPFERHARLIAEIVKGRLMEFAYYTRLGSRVCSIHGRRGDTYTRWEDVGPGKAAVELLSGNAKAEYRPGTLRIRFEEVGRMHYCGMEGELNGHIEIANGKSECSVGGVFD